MKIYILILILLSAHIYCIDYQCLNYGTTTKVHIITVNTQMYACIAVRAHDFQGLETVESMAIRYAAIAAINGGFFKKEGTPAGALKINSTWYGLPTKNRGAIGWSYNETPPLIDRILTEQDDYNAITVIPHLNSDESSNDLWNSVDFIVGGTPLLIYNNQIITDYTSEQTVEDFRTKKHNRTAIGIQENGDWVFVVVEGRLYGLVGGMTIPELAQYMYDLGCVDAVNLDGGRSSTLIINGQRMTSYNCAVSDGIMVIQKP